MATETLTTMTGEEMIALSKKHTLFEWSAQAKVDPIPVARAKGIYFWTPEGKRFLDFNSQLMCVNIGHGDERVIRAIQRAGGDAGLRQPVHGHRAARAAGREARRDHARATSTSSSSPTAAPKPTRTRSSWRALSTGRHKILARYRSYHGATAGSMTLTGDPRRWAAEPGMPGVVHVLDPYHGIERGWDTARAVAGDARGGDPARRAAHHRRLHPRDRSPAPTASWCRPTATSQGVRELCTKHGILMICRRGDVGLRPHRRVVRGRSLERRARPDDDGEGADERLRAARRRRHAARASPITFSDKVFYGGLTYNSHPLACAAALATHRGLRRGRPHRHARARMGAVMKELLRRAGAQASVGRRGALARPVRHRRAGPRPRDDASRWRRSTAPRTRWPRSAGSSATNGLYTFVRWNTFFTNPPLCITEAELREGFAIIDRGLEITDRAVT